MAEICAYTVDADNVLIAVGGSWDRFARENGASELAEPAPLGRPLFEFIADRTTSQLYHQVLAQVRARKERQAFDIRCDSPRMRRFLRLTFVPAPLRAVAVESELLREEPRAAVALLVRGGARSSEVLESCSWCERVSVEGEWYDIEEAVARLRSFENDDLPALSHGICDDCLARVERQLETL